MLYIAPVFLMKFEKIKVILNTAPSHTTVLQIRYIHYLVASIYKQQIILAIILILSKILYNYAYSHLVFLMFNALFVFTTLRVL